MAEAATSEDAPDDTPGGDAHGTGGSRGGAGGPGGHRLPGWIRPQRYDLRLRVDPDAEAFRGTVEIEVELDRPATEVTLHALDLRIAEAVVLAGGPQGTDVPVSAVRPDPDREWVTLELGAPLPAGRAAVRVDYEADFCEQLVGLYRSTFTVDGATRALAVTQFESTHARRALPCFDEPVHKARFRVAVEAPEELVVVSNAAEVSRGPGSPGFVVVTFAETVPMSTYLLALVVGPLEATAAREVPGRDGPVELRVVHPPGKEHLAGFALEVAEAALGFFEDYYDLPLPGDKVDLVAVPDFAFGAMENLGCVTFREVLLLVDPDAATPRELQRVADVINHELAHMWFGDLVTMRWWNGIWLNEAFATFMEVSASDAFRPEWDVWTTFGLSRSAAFETDALRSTRPVEFEVDTPADAEAMFDILTYEKGCSVVRMIEQYLGPERFRDGIRRYLRRHQWGNTDTADLWDALEEASGEPVRRIMDEWIHRGGHPVVTAELADGGVRLDQHRALARPGPTGASGPTGAAEIAERFPVPLVLATGGPQDAPARRVLLGEVTEVALDGDPPWVQPNLGGNGFFRTLLDTPARDALAAAGRPPLERFVLLDDLWFGVRTGAIDLAGALGTVSVLVGAGEDDPSVWRRIAGICEDLHRLRGPRHRGETASWVRGLLNGPRRAHPIGGPDAAGADPRAAEVASIVLVTAADSGDDHGALAEARAAFGDPAAPPVIAAGALEVVARHATAAEHAEIERRWREAPTPQDEQRHLAALVHTEDPGLMARSLDLLRTEARAQDAPYVLRGALANPTLGAMAWEALAGAWEETISGFPTGSVPRMLAGIRGFTGRASAGDVAAFLGDHPLPTGGRQVEQHVEAMWATVEAAERLAS